MRSACGWASGEVREEPGALNARVVFRRRLEQKRRLLCRCRRCEGEHAFLAVAVVVQVCERRSGANERALQHGRIAPLAQPQRRFSVRSLALAVFSFLRRLRVYFLKHIRRVDVEHGSGEGREQHAGVEVEQDVEQQLTAPVVAKHVRRRGESRVERHGQEEVVDAAGIEGEIFGAATGQSRNNKGGAVSRSSLAVEQGMRSFVRLFTDLPVPTRSFRYSILASI